MDFVVRHATAEDRPYVIKTWLGSYRTTWPANLIPKGIYAREMEALFATILERATVLLAVFPEDATEIMGFCVYEPAPEATVVHWLYSNRKGHYIGWRLLQSLEPKLIVATLPTATLRALASRLRREGIGLVFNPWSLRFSGSPGSNLDPQASAR